LVDYETDSETIMKKKSVELKRKTDSICFSVLKNRLKSASPGQLRERESVSLGHSLGCTAIDRDSC